MKIFTTISTTERMKLSTAFLACLIILVSCSPGTTITGSWKDPSASGYKDFFVTVLTHNLGARSVIEHDIATKLRSKDVKVTQSLEIFPSNVKFENEAERKAAVEKVQSLGYDAIITVSLVKKAEETRYVPGTTQYAPMNYGFGTGYNGAGYYGSFGGYYNYGYSTYSTRGYYEEDKIYFVESNLYDAKTTKLMWSAQSKTFNPSDITSASSDFAWSMVDRLKKDKLVFNAPTKK